MRLIKYFCTIAFVMLSFASFGQDVINEEMLDDIETNAKPLWSLNEPAFATNNIPDKYKKESAVIIGYKRSVNIDKKSRAGFFSKGERSLLFYENVRFKIKLSDRHSVERFTEIYFRFNEKEDGFSARVYKAGEGQPVPVSLDAAVGVESSSDIPEFFKSFFDQESGKQTHYYKVAIPNLEPGDILEYVSVTKSKLNVASSGYIEFTPHYELANKVYPILFNQIIMETDDKSFFKSMSFNGAPDFKKETTGTEFNRYIFTDTDRGIEKDVNFLNTYRVYPLTKFQVIYSNKDDVKGALIGQKGELKTGFTKEELSKKAWEDFALTGNYYWNSMATINQYLTYTFGNMKKSGAYDWVEKDFINRAYYQIRNGVLFRDNYYSDKTFAYMFTWMLNQRKIPYDLIISVSNAYGTLKEVLFDQEIRYIVRLNNGVYYFNTTEHSNPGDLVESLAGNAAYIIKEPNKKTGAQEIEDLVLPESKITDNTNETVTNAALASDMSTMNINRTSTYLGLSKTRNIDDALRYTNYILDDWRNTGGGHPTEGMNEKQTDDYNNMTKTIKDRNKDSKPIFQKRELQGEYPGNTVTVKSFTLDSDGRSLKKIPLVVKEEFDLNGLVRKAGKKYLVNVPGLIGSQLQIKKQERTRKYDINVGMPRTLSWKINFKVPAGYTVDGLKELNSMVDNEAGSFISTAVENNGTVVINIKKVYKQAQMSKDLWPKMLEFVDAAYNFNYRYILLSPKN